MRRLVLAAALLALCAMPRAASAWGVDAHRYIMDRAIDRLPPELRPFYDRWRPYLVERSVDPDLWRLAGWDDEPPRHFMDMDAYGAYPFPDLPRDYDRAVERYGIEFVQKNGLVPWRVAEMYGRLRRAFEDQKKGGSDYALSNARFYSAVLAHYVSDAHVPLHAVVNYDGQVTGQWGIHGRFESDLFERYRDRLTVTPPALGPVRDPRALTFDVLLSSYKASALVLAADLKAVAGRTQYDDGYYDLLFGDLRTTLEERLGGSISAVSALITSAWEDAGRPELPVDPPRAIKPVRTKPRS
jgi:hypothetical protein